MNIDLELPISLEGITLRQYQEYLKLSKQWKEDTDEVLIRKETLRIFCNVSKEDFDKLPMVVIEQAMTYLSELFSGDTPLIRHFFMEGKDKDGNDAKLDFGFVPKLDDMSFGEFIDLENYMKDWDTMHKAMAVLFRPVIYRRKDYYRIDDYGGSDRYSDVMLDMPLNVALGASVFFYRLGSKLPLLTMDYLQRVMKEKGVPHQLKQTLGEDGDGINRYMNLLKEMYEDSMKLQSFRFINV